MSRCPAERVGLSHQSDILSAAVEAREASATITVLTSQEPGSGLLPEQFFPFENALTTRGEVLHSVSAPGASPTAAPVCSLLAAPLPPQTGRSNWGQHQQQVRAELLLSVGMIGSCCPDRPSGAGGDGEALRGN
ncbi:hypothetical protein MDA_GLEAN10006008 [Myotis davidii]|uniref:Uncharacterized protein n=1 Tax=Myotis davidii TaxID=225400 RepID=L5LGR5_MYODS|nr:hypothetical protein MDA_GLEAN10006008 [Myotis davidii]